MPLGERRGHSSCPALSALTCSWALVQTDDEPLLIASPVRPLNNETYRSPGRIKLESKGINVNGFQIG